MNIHGNSDQAKADRAPAQRNAVEVKSINLALQGGGAHGAFTWGVLDRLLEEPRIAIEGISATSAGAMNASVLAYGMTMGGREGARQALTNLWCRIADAAWLSPLQPSLYDRMTGDYALSHSPAHLIFDIMSRVLSPYQLNPLNYNPLRTVLEQVVDFERLRAGCATKLFVSATNVRTGKVKIFTERDICVDRVLASACLPFIHQAVEIDGEHYWDGGYMGNPAIFPLIYGCETRDVLVVHVNPIERSTVPTTARDIMNRVDEISFNSSLMREMRAVAFVTKLIDDGKLNPNEFKRMLVHAISADDVMRELGVASKLNADWGFLQHLNKVGRNHTQAWLDKNFDNLGVASTVDIRGVYL
jgi:NTE family protein